MRNSAVVEQGPRIHQETFTGGKSGLQGKVKGAAVAVGGLAALAIARSVPPSAAPLPTCPFNALTGLDCPLCGGTRSMHALLNGDFSSAIDYNVFAVFVAIPALLVFVVWVAVSLWRKNVWNFPRLSWLVVAMMGAFWLVRNLPFSWAQPLRA